MVVIKTFADYETQVRQNITAAANVAVHTGSMIHDTVISPSAYNIYTISYINEYVSRLQSLDSTLALLSDTAFLTELSIILNKTLAQVQGDISTHIDRVANNYLITRNIATTSAGVGYMGSTTQVPVSIAQGSQVKATSGIVYSVVSAVSGTLAYDAELRLYVIPVQLQSVTSGSVANAAAYTINILVSSITGITYVTNKVATTGGKDIETDAALISRIKAKFLGINLSTKAGIESKTKNNFATVGDVYAVSNGDPEMIRDGGYGGSIDVYIQNSSIIQATQTMLYSGGSITPLPDTFYKPFDTRSFIVTNLGGTVTYNGYLQKDTSSVFAGSYQSKDRIYWNGTTLPPVGTTIKVTYYYNNNIKSIQDFYNLDENNQLGVSLLVKEAYPVNVSIQFQITATGKSKDAVIVDLKSRISNYIGAFGLGQSLQQSDIIGIAENTPGVDRVVMPMVLFNTTGVTTIADVIPATANQYIKLNSLVIT